MRSSPNNAAGVDGDGKVIYSVEGPHIIEDHYKTLYGSGSPGVAIPYSPEEQARHQKFYLEQLGPSKVVRVGANAIQTAYDSVKAPQIRFMKERFVSVSEKVSSKEIAGNSDLGQKRVQDWQNWTHC
jgi:hypothetical protein